MRISDWSSDVCSSDLVRYPVPPLHLRADSVAYHTSDAVRTDQIARLKGLLVIVLADDPNCNALLILLRACEAGVEAYLDGRKFLHLFREHCLGLILRYPLGMFGIAVIPRSEEHTSELQSLMSISY